MDRLLLLVVLVVLLIFTAITFGQIFPPEMLGQDIASRIIEGLRAVCMVLWWVVAIAVACLITDFIFG